MSLQAPGRLTSGPCYTTLWYELRGLMLINVGMPTIVANAGQLLVARKKNTGTLMYVVSQARPSHSLKLNEPE